VNSTEVTWEQVRDTSHDTQWGDLWRWFALFLLFFVLYATTANRGAQWQDSGFHILRVVEGQLLNPRGLALSHPLHHWLGRAAAWALPVEPCLAVTLISGLAGAVAVANVFGCVRTLTGRSGAALLAAVSLGVAHTFWQLATVTESYTLCAALLSGECWCLAAYARSGCRKRLCGALLLNGLGVANHLLAGLTTPVLLFVVIYGLRNGRIRAIHALAAAGLWVAGSMPYMGMVLGELLASGEMAGTLRSALFGHTFAEEVLNASLSPRLLGITLGFALLSFPNLLLSAAAYGLARGGRTDAPRLARRALAAGLILHAVFVLRYRIVDQHTFLLPTFVLLCIFGGIGFAAAGERMTRQRTSPRRVRAAMAAAVGLLILTPAVYAVVPPLARHFRLLKSVARHKPYRDDYTYLLTPWSVADRSADRMSREAVALAGQDGLIVFEDSMAQFAIRYQAIRERRDRVQIVSAASSAEPIAAATARGAGVILVPADSAKPRTEPPTGSWRRVSDVYVWTTSSPSTAPAQAP